MFESENKDMTVTALPITRGVGSIEVLAAGRCVGDGVNLLVDTFLEKANHGDEVNVTVTSKFGNEIRVSELVLTTIPGEPAPVEVVVKNWDADKQAIVEEPLVIDFKPEPKATLRCVKLETETPSYATKLFNQLTSGFHFDEKLYDPTFDQE